MDVKDYFIGLGADIAEDLEMFSQYILPVFESRGFTKAQALAYYSNRQIEDRLDQLLDMVEPGDKDKDDVPWKP